MTDGQLATSCGLIGDFREEAIRPGKEGVDIGGSGAQEMLLEQRSGS